MMQITSIRQIELLAMLALPVRRTLHRQTQEFELPVLQAPRPRSKKISPSFSTRGVCNAGRRSRTTSWSKGLYHRSDVLVLIQKLTARANAGWRLSRQCELELLEQDF